MTNTTNSLFVAIDPATGQHLRDASAQEIRAYYEANRGTGRGFYKAIRVGNVVINEYTGPGIWFGSAGF